MPKKEKKYNPFDDPNHPMYRARPREDGRSKRKVKISGSFTPKPKIKGPKRLSNTKYYESRMRSRGKKVEEFSVGGIAKAAKTLINKYKPKLKNEKEVYSRVKQDYSDVIKNYEKTQQRKQRNRKAAGTVGGVTAATVVTSNVKDKK